MRYPTRPPTVVAAMAIVLAATAASASPPIASPPADAAGTRTILAQAQGASAPAGAERPQASDAGPDQSGLETPAAFRFPGHMASVWSRADVEAIHQDTPVTLPLMIHDREPFEEGVTVWDAWPVRTPDGAVAEIDGWVVMVGLSAELAEIEETGRDFYTLSTWRYWYTRDGEWRPGGVVFTREDGLGSRQWAGSTFYDPDTREITFYYTAVGRPDAESLADDDPERPISIHNEAAGRPLAEQRLASVTASLSASGEGIAFSGFGEHRIIGEADGFWYDTMETYLASSAVYGFRDPEYMVDPLTGREHVLFTANGAGIAGPYNGVVGLMTREDDGDWRLDPPLIVSTDVNSQLERPHVVYRDGQAYLFFSTHDFTFASDIHGPRGLYGFHSQSGRLTGRWTPINEHGLVAANPRIDPAQVYSFLVLPDGHVMSYLNETWGFELDPANEERSFAGAPGPMFRLRFDGEIVSVGEANNAR
ncbi:glycoside hydrolase family 68 protein [Salinarimonas chemoclinalis]|uniref:glycoside hydrolase family 68 protein n=1 Tax=Salinarimonas chemoclinalis TaxID=3241599 RepID=UPI0035577DF4